MNCIFSVAEAKNNEMEANDEAIEDQTAKEATTTIVYLKKILRF